jgi:hypothetical protein
LYIAHAYVSELAGAHTQEKYCERFMVPGENNTTIKVLHNFKEFNPGW